ncbi:AraC family transcriptional regulator [Arthrobacter sp. B0490]|uniref:AraC family transcriptional regulator n=1 Tax=Arthrobacter sp. B0490 TaxID=2058891 RepID=UPI000CE4BF9E|nr:AraC family transcriptional regulator [Arthrobacter sp. B0490]
MKLSSYQYLSVPNFSINNLREVLDEAGLDWQSALERADIAVDAVLRHGGTIPARKELAFQLEFVALTPDRPDLWIRAAQAYTTSTTGARGMALSTAPTIAAWVEVASSVDYAPALFRMTPLMTRAGSITGVEYTYSEAPAQLIPFSAYRELFVTSRSLSWLWGGAFPFSLIEFPLAEIEPEATVYASGDIECGSDSLKMWWDPAISNTKLPFGNAFQHAAWVRAENQILASFRASGDWPTTVARTIKMSPTLNKKLANVAATLRVSPRTLQRRLEMAGRDFAQVRDEVLQELACDLLSDTDHSVAQISRSLGYTDPTSFTIAFKRWMGTPPSAFRDATRYQGAAHHHVVHAR